MLKTFLDWVKIKEMAGTGAIVQSCKPTATYQVWGACSDLGEKSPGAARRKETKFMDKESPTYKKCAEPGCTKPAQKGCGGFCREHFLQIFSKVKNAR